MEVLDFQYLVLIPFNQAIDANIFHIVDYKIMVIPYRGLGGIKNTIPQPNDYYHDGTED